MERRPSLAVRTASTLVLLATIAVQCQQYYNTGGTTWRGLVSKTPITPAWWSDAILQSIAFALQLLSVLYWWLPAGYAIDHRKVVLVETVALPWLVHWVALAAADVAFAALGQGPVTLVVTSLAGALAGFAALYGCLRTLHPRMVHISNAEAAAAKARAVAKGAAGAKAAGGGEGAHAKGGLLVRKGPSWLLSYTLFRLPTAMSAALCAVRMAVDGASLAVALWHVSTHDMLNPSLALLLVVMVGAILVLQQLDDVGYAVTVGSWLMCLIVATHTALMVKCVCIALVIALTMRAAIKYIPDDDDVQVAEMLAKRAS